MHIHVDGSYIFISHVITLDAIHGSAPILYMGMRCPSIWFSPSWFTIILDYSLLMVRTLKKFEIPPGGDCMKALMWMFDIDYATRNISTS